MTIRQPPSARPTRRTAPAGAAAGGDVVIATIGRPVGDTGVHTHTRVLRDGIVRAGLTCAVVSPFPAGWKWSPVFAVRPLVLHRVNKNWSTRWHRRWHFAALSERLGRHLARRTTAAVVAQCPLSARAALDARDRLRGDFPVALVCHFNGSEAREYRDKGELDDDASYRAIVALEDEVLRDVDQVIHVSHWSRSEAESRLAARPRSSAVIWNGIGEVDPRPKLTRADIGLAPDDLVLMNVGTLEPRKNQVGLIDLFAAVIRRHPRSRLVLVGDGPHRGEVARKVESANLAGRVTLLGARRDVPDLLPLADLYVHYATLENGPVAVLEAARAGLPWAAVPAGGVRELLDQLGSGVALTPGDPSGSLRALEPLLTRPELRAELGRRARERFLDSFTREAMVAHYLDALGLSPAVAATGPRARHDR